MKKNREDNLHMVVISQLYRQNPTTWTNTIKQLEDGKQVMRALYAPLRSAVNLETKRPGLGMKALERGLRSLENAPNYNSIRNYSLQGFSLFRVHILPEIDYITDDFVNKRPEHSTFNFESYQLTGNFHAKVVFKDGTEKLIYLHPSEWNEDRTTCFIELLVALAESKYGMCREQVLFVDLRKGIIIKPSKAFKKLRKEISRTIELAVRLKRAS